MTTWWELLMVVAFDGAITWTKAFALQKAKIFWSLPNIFCPFRILNEQAKLINGCKLSYSCNYWAIKFFIEKAADQFTKIVCNSSLRCKHSKLNKNNWDESGRIFYWISISTYSNMTVLYFKTAFTCDTLVWKYCCCCCL